MRLSIRLGDIFFRLKPTVQSISFCVVASQDRNFHQNLKNQSWEDILCAERIASNGRHCTRSVPWTTVAIWPCTLFFSHIKNNSLDSFSNLSLLGLQATCFYTWSQVPPKRQGICPNWQRGRLLNTPMPFRDPGRNPMSHLSPASQAAENTKYYPKHKSVGGVTAHISALIPICGEKVTVHVETGDSITLSIFIIPVGHPFYF